MLQIKCFGGVERLRSKSIYYQCPLRSPSILPQLSRIVLFVRKGRVVGDSLQRGEFGIVQVSLVYVANRKNLLIEQMRRALQLWDALCLLCRNGSRV